MVFEGTTGLYECNCCFNFKYIRTKKKYVNLKWIRRNFCLHSNPRNDDMISALGPGLKMGMVDLRASLV